MPASPERRRRTGDARPLSSSPSSLRGARRVSAAVLASLLVLAPAAAHGGQLRPAADAIRAASAARLGEGVEVSVTALDLLSDGAIFSDARPDPAARLGQPIRFTLVTGAGAAMRVTASIAVTVDHVVVRQPIARGATVSAGEVAAARGELRGVPIKRLPALPDVVGARALRAIDAGAVVLPGFVLAPRAVEPGDTVVVSAAVGAIEVTAAMVAVDGGRIGDVIRVRNPESKTYLRGRIVRPGFLEVVHVR
jgi:flagella basal body P-ring formation protein FlgA